MEFNCFDVAACYPKMLHINARQRLRFALPLFRRNIKIGGPNQIAYSAALMGLFNSFPELIELCDQLLGLIRNQRGIRQQVKEGPGCARDRSIKLPPRKDRYATSSNGILDNVLRPGQPLSGESGMNRRQ